VRNPLHSIGLTLQHLRETGRPVEPGRAAEFDRSLEIIRAEIGRLDQLVDNFLRFARSGSLPQEPVDPAELLRETARLVEKQAERHGVHLTLDIAEGTPRILADPESIRSAVLNLVLNGFEAMPEGGTLTLGLRAEGAEVVLEVGDTGEGIPEDAQEKIFDFAYTTRESGSGLGLAMVHEIVVEDHGGRVSLESGPGQGTTVRLALPVEKGKSEEPGAGETET
jgi:signal transduction histidine kinase